MYLLDTNVVSELRRVRPHGAVLAWVESVADEDLHLSAVTIGEIQAGIEISREQDPNKAAEIEVWLDQVAETYNMLSMDARTFRFWARLMHRKSDHVIEDAMIAATATFHNLIVVTRNVRDFKASRCSNLEPFQISSLSKLHASERRWRGRPPSDAASFLHSLMSGDVLPPELLTEMTTCHPISEQSLPGRPWETTGYGLGLMIGRMASAGIAMSHSGAGPGSVRAVYHFGDRPSPCTVAAFAMGDEESATEYEVARLARLV
jgi:toxin FitB